MPLWKPMLMILPGGILLGVLVGQMADPVMKFAEQPDWRARFAAQYSTASMQFVDGGPQDLSPAIWCGPSYAWPVLQDPVYAYPSAYAAEADYSFDEHYLADAEDPGLSADLAEPDPSDEVDEAALAAADTAAEIADPPAAPPAARPASRPGREAFEGKAAQSPRRGFQDTALSL